MTEIIHREKWIAVRQLTLKITNTNNVMVSFRIFATIKIKGKQIEYDMFPHNPDFSVSNKGNANIITGKGFKIKTKFKVI
jgi:hypothetical protein